MIRFRLAAAISVTCLALVLISASAAGQTSTPASPMHVNTGAGTTRAAALGAGFTFQGGLSTATGPVTGTCDLRFSLFNALNECVSPGVLKSARGLAEDTSAGALELENTFSDNKWHIATHRDHDNLEFWFALGGTSWSRPASLDRAGNLQVAGNITQGAIVERNLQTLAEQASPRIERFQAGDVLCWDPAGQQMEKCAQDASPLVVAVADQDGKPIIIGVERVRVVGPIRAGDLLVASAMPGCAVAWSRDHEGYPPPGVILAKALEAMDMGEGTVKAMILPR